MGANLRNRGCECCPECGVFHENWLQCHGVEDPEDECTEPINGLDFLEKWFSDVSDVWVHKAFKDGGDVVEGYLVGTVPFGTLGDHARIYPTVALPRSFRAIIESPLPEVGSKWRIGWMAQTGGAHLAVEIEGPPDEDTPCSTFRLVDISCTAHVALDRPIPFYFQGEIPRSLEMTVCIQEILGLIIISATCVSATPDAEAPGGERVYIQTFSHHIANDIEQQEPCAGPLQCYPFWIELDKDADGAYEFGEISIVKTRGERDVSLTVGDCTCEAIDDPYFADLFDRADETFVLPVDSTDHWRATVGTWQIVSNELKAAAGSGGAQEDAVQCFKEFSHPTDFAFNVPLSASVDMKLPEDDSFAQMYLFPGIGVRAELKAGPSGRFAIRVANLTGDLGTVLASVDIDDVETDEYHRVTMCCNGRVVIASVVLNDARAYELMIPISGEPATTVVTLIVPDTADGNIAGDYFFNDFSVSDANNAEEVAEEEDDGYANLDKCPCCIPNDCQRAGDWDAPIGTPAIEVQRVPLLPSDITSCFWDTDDNGDPRYLGSWSGVADCDSKDDTTRWKVPFTVTDQDGYIKLIIGSYWVKIIFEAPDDVSKSELQLSTDDPGGDEPRLIDKLLEDETHTLIMCLGMGQLAATIDGELSATAVISIPVPTSPQPTIDYEGCDIGAVLFSHHLYDEECEDCFGALDIPCEDPELQNCRDGDVAQALVATVTFDMDEPDDPCCDGIREYLGGGVIVKSTGTTGIGDGEACCDVPAPFPAIDQCAYFWSGQAQADCAVGGTVSASYTVGLYKYADGYRLCGSVAFEGGDAGIFSGASAVIAPPDEPPDCTSLGGSIPLTCFAPGGPGFEVPPCGLHDLTMSVSAA